MNIRTQVLIVFTAVALSPSLTFAQMDSTMPPPPSGGPQNRNTTEPQGQQSTGSPEFTGQEMRDRAFIRKAGEGGMAEVMLGQLALQKTANADIKQFAQKMIDDHTALMAQMAPIADSLGIRTPKKLGKADQAEYDKLNGLSGADFDKEYLTAMVEDHHKDLHEFHTEAMATQQPELRDAVTKGQTVIWQHAQMVDKLALANGIPVPQRKRPQPTS